MKLTGLGTTTLYTTPQIQQMIVSAANAYGVPPSIALGIAAHESNFDPNATHVNTNGTTDYGVMQLNTTTVQTLGVSNPLDPQQNIDAGVSLIAKYLQQYNGNTTNALWAYASGPGAVSNGVMNSTASGFINSVQSYQVPANVDLGIGADSGSGDTTLTPDAGTDSSTDTGTPIDTPTLILYGGVALIAAWVLTRG